jgi:tetratricopeptide (TPR) repeat protein
MRNLAALLVLGAACSTVCRAGLGNDDGWFNGTSMTPATPPGSPVGGRGRPAFYLPPMPAGPTKEQLEQKDLKEASDDFVDKGNKFYKSEDWAHAIVYYKKALEYDPDNDDAVHNLQFANQHLAAEQARLIAEQKRKEEEWQAEEQRRWIAGRDQSIEQNRAYHNTQLERLMVEADHIKVPLPNLGPANIHLHEGIILGLFDPQEDAEKTLTAVKSPFTGKPYTKDELFSTADSKTAHEALRGFLDNQSVGEYTLNTEYGKQLIARLNGTEFDRLIAHSNGATIAEALIKRGIIKVDELNVVGGDRSLVNQAGYQNLIDSGAVKRIVVWVNPGDTIPVGSSLSYVTPMGRVNVAPLMTSAEHYAYQLTGTHQGGDAKVEYRLLKGPAYVGQDIHMDKTIFDAHDLAKSYLPNIGAYFGNHGNSGSN